LARQCHVRALGAEQKKNRELILASVVPLVPPTTPKALPAPVDNPEEQLVSIVARCGVTGTLTMLSRIEQTRAVAG